MTVIEAIEKAEVLLPGVRAPEGEKDPRWQAIIDIFEYIEHEPETIWLFVERWGQHPDEDLRAAIATCLLEHLLEHHFDLIFPRVEQLARSNRLFAETVQMCSNFGQSELPDNKMKLDQLWKELQTNPDKH